MTEDRPRVLVVDDEPGILHFISASLELAGFEVIATPSGEEGLELARSKKPDIMLVDILMVPLSGFDVVQKLRKFSNMPVIVFTARKIIADQAIQAGANDFIGKPFKPEELEAKIRALLRHQSQRG